MNCLVPQSLNIDRLLEINPANGIVHFNSDHLIYLLHLISEIPAMERNAEAETDFVPIHAATVQRLISNYSQYLTYLIDADVLICDGQYIPGRKSKGYQFVKAYRGAVTTIPISDKKLIRKLMPLPLSVSMQRRYRHLVKWYGPELSVRYDVALDYLQQDLERKVMHMGLRDREARTRRRKDPYKQYNHARVALEKFRAAAFRISIDTKGFRLHSLLSNIKSELRNCLIYNGLEMVSIDICNCQPYLMLLLLQKSFWDTHPSHMGLHYTDLFNAKGYTNNSKYSSSLFVPSYIMISEIGEMQARRGFEAYRKVTTNGRFYEQMTELMTSEMEINELDRKQVKGMLFQVLFTSNRYIGQEDAEPKRIFKRLFPDVYKVMSMIKKKGKELLPILLQRIESHLVLEVITKRIARENPKMPLFTIHDSIVSNKGNEQIINAIMKEELERVIGFAPQLRVEHWSVDNLRFNDGRKFIPKQRLSISATEEMQLGC